MQADHRAALAPRPRLPSPRGLASGGRGAGPRDWLFRGVLVSALLAGVAGPARAEADSGSGAFLLIDGATIPGRERLTGCDRALSAMHERLDGHGVASTLLVAPTSDAIREALLRFASFDAGRPHALLFCGYVAGSGGDVFALGSEAGSSDNPDLDAVSIRAFSRVAGAPSGLVALDLHAATADDGAARALALATDRWKADAALPGRKLAAIDRAPDAAHVTAAMAGSTDLDPATLGAASPTPPPPAAPMPAPTPTPMPMPAPMPVPTPSPPVPATAAAVPPEPIAPARTLPTPATPAPTRPVASAVVPTATGRVATTPPKPGKPVVRAAAPAARKPAPKFDRTSQRIQVALLARGFYGGRVTGTDTPATRAAVRRYQRSINHAATGTLAPDELKLLLNG